MFVSEYFFVFLFFARKGKISSKFLHANGRRGIEPRTSIRAKSSEVFSMATTFPSSPILLLFQCHDFTSTWHGCDEAISLSEIRSFSPICVATGEERRKGGGHQPQLSLSCNATAPQLRYSCNTPFNTSAIQSWYFCNNVYGFVVTREQYRYKKYGFWTVITELSKHCVVCVPLLKYDHESVMRFLWQLDYTALTERSAVTTEWWEYTTLLYKACQNGDNIFSKVYGI